eukprot:TRINITY_DN1465_c1_g1_i1.p3 TRINITY_DN1465_c1_g1~~TRINITY_DN1465_c1_g1_i1.p3  ORF type:complete len:102 (+),score=5.91 TRINITY_DN1465_c1_g1_i1:140-445(+)
MQPGVPDVSSEFSDFIFLAMPRSVILTQPQKNSYFFFKYYIQQKYYYHHCQESNFLAQYLYEQSYSNAQNLILIQYKPQRIMFTIPKNNTHGQYDTLDHRH